MKQKIAGIITAVIIVLAGVIPAATAVLTVETQAAAAVTAKVANKKTGFKITCNSVAGAAYYRYAVTDKSTNKKSQTDAKTTEYSFSATNGHTYAVTVTALNKNKKSLGSSAAKTIKYLAPVTITEFRENINKKLFFKWTQNAKASGYHIYRSVNGGSFGEKPYKVIQKNDVLSFLDENAKMGNDYQYRIYAESGNYHSCVAQTAKIRFEHTWVTTKVEPTCTSQGSTTTVCKWCKTLKSAPVVHKALGHQWKCKTVEEPTCQRVGWKTKTCSRCKEIQNEVIDKVACVGIASNHPNCAKGGTVYLKCKWCGKDIGTTYQAPKAHTLVKDPGIPATPTRSGKTEGSHCSVCGAVIIPQKVIPPTTKIDKVKLTKIANTQKGIVIKWAKAAKADGYFVYRKAGSGKYKKYVTIPKKSINVFTDKKVKTGILYTYKITAYKKVQNKILTGCAYNKKKIIYVPVMIFKSAKPASATSVKLSWKKEKAVSGYEILVKSKVNGTESGTIGKNKKSAIITGLTKGTYKIYLRAYLNAHGKKYYGAWSARPVTFVYPGYAVIF